MSLCSGPFVYGDDCRKSLCSFLNWEIIFMIFPLWRAVLLAADRVVWCLNGVQAIFLKCLSGGNESLLKVPASTWWWYFWCMMDGQQLRISVKYKRKFYNLRSDEGDIFVSLVLFIFARLKDHEFRLFCMMASTKDCEINVGLVLLSMPVFKSWKSDHY